MVDIDTAIERLEKALETLRSAKAIMNGGQQSEDAPKPAQVRLRNDTKLVANMKRLRKEGLTYREIGLKVGRHLSTVHYHLNG